MLRKSLNDKGWAEKQTAGFTNWLNFTLVGAEQLRHGAGDDGEEEDGGLTAEIGGVSSSPLKAMVAMVRNDEMGLWTGSVGGSRSLSQGGLRGFGRGGGLWKWIAKLDTIKV